LKSSTGLLIFGGVKMFEAIILGGIFLTAMLGAYWILDKLDISVNFYRYMDFGGILLIFLTIMIVGAIAVICGVIGGRF
ncbi:MAG: hypothetical protein IJU28_03210, partial [Clostridia bacterium]|nr:hypothetical protein [Clostridia bacterium]